MAAKRASGEGSITWEMPTSPSLAVPFPSIRKLASLMSQWMTSCLCIHRSAVATCHGTEHVSRSLVGTVGCLGIGEGQRVPSVASKSRQLPQGRRVPW